MPNGKNKKRPNKREAPISYRPPKNLRTEFDARVKKSGLCTSAFITKAIFDVVPSRQSRRPPVEQKLLAQILAQAANINDQLNEIALTGGDNSNNSLSLETTLDELTVIRAALLKAMGRNP